MVPRALPLDEIHDTFSIAHAVIPLAQQSAGRCVRLTTAAPGTLHWMKIMAARVAM